MFSFLCPAYRTEKYLAETIESVRSQSCDDWELIVVDNGMSDRVVEIVERYPDPRLRLIRQENRGLTGGLTAAASIAIGRYLVPLDSDDLVTAEYCAQLGELLEEHPAIDALACDATLFTDEGHDLAGSYVSAIGIGWRPRLSESLQLTDIIGGKHPYYGAAIRRSTWEALGGVRPEAEKAVDLDLWLRLTGGGYDVRVIPNQLARYRYRDDSVSRDPSSVESFERTRDSVLLEAAEKSGNEQNFVALEAAQRRYRYVSSMRRARWAFARSDTRAAREHAVQAFRERRTARSATIVVGLSIAPGLLRQLYPIKRRLTPLSQRLIARVASPASRYRRYFQRLRV